MVNLSLRLSSQATGTVWVTDGMSENKVVVGNKTKEESREVFVECSFLD